MSANQDIDDFLGKIESITGQLKDLDKAFDESVIMSKIICNLPAEYDSLMTAWNSMPEGQQKLDNLMLQLLKEETKLKRQLKPLFGLRFLDGKHSLTIVGSFLLRLPKLVGVSSSKMLHLLEPVGVSARMFGEAHRLQLCGNHH